MKFFDKEYKTSESDQTEMSLFLGGVLSTLVAFLIPMILSWKKFSNTFDLKFLLFLAPCLLGLVIPAIVLFIIMYLLSDGFWRIYYRFDKKWKKALLWVLLFLIIFAIVVLFYRNS